MTCYDITVYPKDQKAEVTADNDDTITLSLRNAIIGKPQEELIIHQAITARYANGGFEYLPWDVTPEIENFPGVIGTRINQKRDIRRLIVDFNGSVRKFNIVHQGEHP